MRRLAWRSHGLIQEKNDMIKIVLLLSALLISGCSDDAGSIKTGQEMAVAMGLTIAHLTSRNI